jgi:hypothetical protein
MPTLPGNVAGEAVHLISLDATAYEYAKRPAGATLAAWSRFEETERRWIMFEWATFAIVDQRGHSLLFHDLASAYLLSLEAALQVLRTERSDPDFAGWLRSHSEYNLAFRGLRTLRHLSAHVRAVAIDVNRRSAVVSRFAHSTTGGTLGWRWQPLSAEDLQSLDRPRLTAAELGDWNRLNDEMLVIGLMRSGLATLRTLLRSAEM